MLWAMLLILTTLFFSCSLTVYSMSDRRSAAVRKRPAVSAMRVRVTVRAVMSVGELSTSDSEPSMSEMAVPRASLPPV